MSVKFQITLPDDLATEMKNAAARMRIPLAQFIRETMSDRLREMRSKRRRKHQPLDWMVGMVHSKETDLAARVDEILYK